MFSRRKTITAKLRQAISDKQDGKCFECHYPLGTKFEIDHEIPLAIGGSNELENLRALCRICHLTKTSDDRKAISNQPRHKMNYVLQDKPPPRKKRTRWPKRKIKSRPFAREEK